ncbi:HD-GYP domain-containing protein [Alkalihalobacillus deserti]|uniref:HD-GYP domain-containing protein n=1 Tax=Alkalihalobacillus deserti TaxID=2879466 RepID=UPI001D15804B|nr:HD-GYP domain-containing protein [Alkalihalobacillus deserti]
MRLITLDRCQPGAKLGKTIYDENRKVLLAKGTELSDRLLAALRRYSIFTIYIDDVESEGIDIAEAIPEELRAEAVHLITEGLDALVGLNSNSAHIRGMIKSGRAVRSFQKIFRDIHSCLKDNRIALNLLASTKIHENYVYTHSVNVAIYACQLAIENGLPLKNIEEIGLGAMLHDIGKMYIPLEVLNKQGKLTKKEFELIQAHSELGFDTLRKVHEIPLPASHCAFQHHERIDGTGYPRGLKGDEIHRYAKIISVADVFDALTSHRVYRPPLLPHQAIDLLDAGKGTQFESKQVELFKGCVAIYPQGLSVKLNDGRTGIVSKYNYNAVGRPWVRIIGDEEQQETKPYEIDLASNDHLSVEIVEADVLLK